MTAYAQRIQHLQQKISTHQAILVTQIPDLLYFTGFRAVTTNEREGFLLITQKSATLYAAAFSPLPSYLSAPSDHSFLNVHRTTGIPRLATTILSSAIQELIVDESGIFVSEMRSLQDALTESKGHSPLKFSPLNRQWIWEQRIVKDDQEITLLRKAGQIVQQALEETLTSLKIGQTERQIASQLDARFRELSADGPAFPTIVAFNGHAALPHHQPGDTALEQESSVLIDCGACVGGYNSDMTRTVWVGKKPSSEFIKIKKIVDQAYEQGRDLIMQRHTLSEPLLASEVDKQVRSHIETAGYGQHYIHTTGHGIGIDVHEPPSLYQTHPLPLKNGMVITVEPGIYLPEKLGYRHENTFLLTSQGAEELTQ